LATIHQRHSQTDRQDRTGEDRQTERQTDRQRSNSIGRTVFQRPFVKRFAQCYRSVVLSVLSCPVCDVSVLWPNGWTDQDETWHSGRHGPWPQCVRWGPRCPPPKGHSPQFSAHFRCGQMAAWIKMPLGKEVGLDTGDFVLDGDPTTPLQKGGRAPQIFGPCLLWPNSWMDQDGTWHGGRPQPTELCVRWGPSPLNFRPMFIIVIVISLEQMHSRYWFVQVLVLYAFSF